MIAEWLANDGHMPPDGTDLTIREVITHFWRFARKHYRRADGTFTSEVDNYRQALRPLEALYGDTLAGDFGPRALRAVRHQMIGMGWCRSNINKQVGRIKVVFKWAVAQELVRPAIHQGLQAVTGLKQGRSEAHESEPVKPVPEGYIEAVQPFVSRQVWAMIQLQLLTGARAGELIKLRPVDLDTKGKIWLYTPTQHKTAHHGHHRTIYIGPRAQAILGPFLTNRPLNAPLFSAIEAETERHNRHQPRSSRSNRPATDCRCRPRRRPREHYEVSSHRRAIQRGCDEAFPPPHNLTRQRVKARGRKKNATRWETPTEWKQRLGAERWRELQAWQKTHRWHPHQLRHNAATNLRREFGIEAAQIILGHRLGSTITEVYAEANKEKVMEIMQQVG